MEDLTVVWHSEPGARAVLGIEPGEAVGRSVWDFLSDEVASRIRQQTSRHGGHPLARGITYLARYELRHRDGTVVEVASTAWRVDRSHFVSVAVPTRLRSVPAPP